MADWKCPKCGNTYGVERCWNCNPDTLSEVFRANVSPSDLKVASMGGYANVYPPDLQRLQDDVVTLTRLALEQKHADVMMFALRIMRHHEKTLPGMTSRIGELLCKMDVRFSPCRKPKLEQAPDGAERSE